MSKSFSYLMEYTPVDTGLDRFGGLPTHLPHNWPRCQFGFERMAFMGQIYASDWFPIDGLCCLQFYTCIAECHTEVDFLHLELVHHGAKLNTHAEGIANPDLPVRTINYSVVEDSMDHETFLRISSDDDQPWPDLKDEHFYEDRLGGIYTFDGSEGPAINRTNRCIGQFRHPCDRETTIFIHHSDEEGIYLHTYC